MNFNRLRVFEDFYSLQKPLQDDLTHRSLLDYLESEDYGWQLKVMLMDQVYF